MVAVAGQVIAGAWVSFTVTVNEQVDELPAASVARKLTADVPTGKKDPDAAPMLAIAGEAVQLSVAEAFANETFAPHCPAAVPWLMLAGQVMPGAWVSLIVTVNEQVDELPEKSCARKVTAVVPTAKKEPEAGPRLVTVGAGKQLSDALALEKDTLAPHWPGVLDWLTFAGQEIAGAVWSTMDTMNVQLDDKAASSVAVRVITTVPGVAIRPAPGDWATSGEPVQLSVAVARPV